MLQVRLDQHQWRVWPPFLNILYDIFNQFIFSRVDLHPSVMRDTPRVKSRSAHTSFVELIDEREAHTGGGQLIEQREGEMVFL